MLVNANFREALSNNFLERVVTFMNHMSTSGQTDTALWFDIFSNNLLHMMSNRPFEWCCNWGHMIFEMFFLIEVILIMHKLWVMTYINITSFCNFNVYLLLLSNRITWRGIICCMMSNRPFEWCCNWDHMIFEMFFLIEVILIMHKFLGYDIY